MTAEGELTPGSTTESVCITCGDEGRIAEVVRAPVDGMASVRTARGLEDVVTSLIEPVSEGDLILVHAGTAIGRIHEESGTA